MVVGLVFLIAFQISRRDVIVASDPNAKKPVQYNEDLVYNQLEAKSSTSTSASIIVVVLVLVRVYY